LKIENLQKYLKFNKEIIKMITKKSWFEFRNTGLLLIINQILHIFGWAIVIDTDDEGNLIDCYPARVKFRGFSEDSVSAAYIKLSKFMKDNVDSLVDEANS